MPDTAVIVAAGLSSRLYPLTSDTPKGLLAIGDESMLSRSIRLLRDNGISRIAVVTGFRADAMRQALEGQATTIVNPFFRECNNMGSLFFARGFTGGTEPFVYLHGDLVYTGDMLADFLRKTSQPGDSCLDLLVAMDEKDEEAMKVRVDSDARLVESSKTIPLADAAGEWTGIAVVQQPLVVFDGIESHMMNVGLTDYDTAAFTSLARGGRTIRCIPSNGGAWKEVDTLDDLESARATFRSEA